MSPRGSVPTFDKRRDVICGGGGMDARVLNISAAGNRAPTSRWMRWALWLSLGIGCVFLFVQEPGPEQHRLVRQLWDLGHLALFGVIGFLVGEYLLSRSWRDFLIALLSAAVVGWLIECMQLLIGRDYSLGDVAADTIGMGCGLLVGGRSQLWQRRRLFVAVSALFLVASVLQMKSTFRSALDAFFAWRTFPVLADFERGPLPSLQRDRFGAGEASLQLESSALRVDLRAGTYPGFVLDDFPNDWRGWRYLVFDLENPDITPLPLLCRIHDAAHNHEHVDRYNRHFTLMPGRQQLRIDLAEVATAPRGRAMDMAAIRSPLCFTPQLRQPRSLRLYAVWLE